VSDVIVTGQVKGIVCDADDLSHLLTSYREQLKSSAAFSSLPDVMQQQLAQFMVMPVLFIICPVTVACSVGQIINSVCLCHCVSVYLHSYGRIS